MIGQIIENIHPGNLKPMFFWGPFDLLSFGMTPAIAKAGGAILCTELQALAQLPRFQCPPPGNCSLPLSSWTDWGECGRVFCLASCCAQIDVQCKVSICNIFCKRSRWSTEVLWTTTFATVQEHVLMRRTGTVTLARVQMFAASRTAIVSALCS